MITYVMRVELPYRHLCLDCPFYQTISPEHGYCEAAHMRCEIKDGFYLRPENCPLQEEKGEPEC